MSSLAGPHNPNRYWRSLAELADTAEFRRFVEAELPGAAPAEGVSRRRWLQLMGASLALAGVTGCRWKKAEILPMAERSPERTPGQPQRFATAMDLAGVAMGLLVTCVDGRPVKIEGNPRHPASLGATDALAQAAILELYDPERSRNVIERVGDREMVRTWEEFTRFARSHFDKLRETGGAGFRVLSEATSSPTVAAMRSRFLDIFPEARWHEYEPIAWRRPGTPVRFALDKADVIVCLDDDLLGSGPLAVRYARRFAERREPSRGTMNRLYVIESRLTVTGAAADHRLALRSGRVAALVAILEEEIASLLKHPNATDAEKDERRQEWVTEAATRDLVDVFLDLVAEGVRARLDEAPGNAPESRGRETLGLMQLFAMAEDLVASRGRSVVTIGPSQPAEVHAAVARINAALGNVGTTVLYMEPSPAETDWRAREESSIGTLGSAMEADRAQGPPGHGPEPLRHRHRRHAGARRARRQSRPRGDARALPRTP